MSQFTNSPDTPAEHVGEHTDGGAGCRASIGSGGISGPGVGLESGESCAQLLSSSASAGSISGVFLGLGAGMLGGSLLGLQAAGGFGGVGQQLGFALRGGFGHSAGVHLGGGFGLVALPAAPGQGGQQQPDPPGHGTGDLAQQ